MIHGGLANLCGPDRKMKPRTIQLARRMEDLQEQNISHWLGSWGARRARGGWGCLQSGVLPFAPTSPSEKRMPRFIKAIASFLTGGAIIIHGHGHGMAWIVAFSYNGPLWLVWCSIFRMTTLRQYTNR
jgi:hypothetical protein